MLNEFLTYSKSEDIKLSFNAKQITKKVVPVVDRNQLSCGTFSTKYSPWEYLIQNDHSNSCRPSYIGLLIDHYKEVDKDGTLDVPIVLSSSEVCENPEMLKQVLGEGGSLTRKKICYLIEFGYSSVVLNRYAQGRITEEVLIKNDTCFWDQVSTPFTAALEKYINIMSCIEVDGQRIKDLPRSIALEVSSLKELLKILVNKGVNILEKNSSEVNKLVYLILNSQRYHEPKYPTRLLHDLISLFSQHIDFSRIINASYNGETLRTWVYKYGLPETVALLGSKKRKL
ncbi:MAG: hypothetical protein V3581_02775 [Candidatus Cardinium sp.]|uniref:hypothetical protein n=1 Tax=Candidatus Cardinium sp. TP TaxID=2961955 RepID=UPI0021AFB018|nr:hypothetical protein [Candidatus Cardinium sp. TP]MCT4697222.1 hypothetical protein [Candidatus Cardinium sp. TP]MDN5247181.1 hypothetical protein [Candidatus Cardinium sp.]